MSDTAFSIVEQGLRFAQERAAVLASDAANAHTLGFTPRDLTPVLEPSPQGPRFAAQVRAIGEPSAGIESAMAATADNALRFRALADQERALLREFKTVSEEERR
jgi:flagellar basal body rod protein FlgB